MAIRYDLSLLIFGRLVSTLLVLVAIRAVTTYLTPQQFGELSLLLTVQMFCGLFLINPVGQHINLHTHVWWDDGTLFCRLKAYRGYILLVALIGFIVVLEMGLHDASINLLIPALSMFAMVIFGTWNATFVPMLNMLGDRDESVKWGILTTATGLVSSILLIQYWSTAAAWFTGQVVGMAIGAWGARRVLHRHPKSFNLSGRFPLFDRRSILTYCIPLAMATGFMWLQLSGYRFWVENFWGLKQLGLLVIGLQLAGQVWALIESLAMQFLSPLLYRHVATHPHHESVELTYSDFLNCLIPIYLVVTGAILLGAPFLLRALVSSQYLGATTFVLFGAGIELCRALGNLISNAAHIKRRAHLLILPYATGALVSVLLIYIMGLQNFSLDWAAASLLVGGFSMLLVMAIVMFRQIRFKADWFRINLGFGVMLLMVLANHLMPISEDMFISIGILIAIGLFSVFAILVIVIRSPSLKRILQVNLKDTR